MPPKIPPMNETIEERKKHFKEYAKKVNERLLKMKSGDSYIYLGFGKWIMNSTNNLIRVLKMNEGNLFVLALIHPQGKNPMLLNCRKQEKLFQKSSEQIVRKKK